MFKIFRDSEPRESYPSIFILGNKCPVSRRQENEKTFYEYEYDLFFFHDNGESGLQFFNRREVESWIANKSVFLIDVKENIEEAWKIAKTLAEKPLEPSIDARGVSE